MPNNQTHSVNAMQFAFNDVEEIQVYDKLPLELRQRIAHAEFTISSKMVHTLWLTSKDMKMCHKAIDQIIELFLKENPYV